MVGRIYRLRARFCLLHEPTGTRWNRWRVVECSDPRAQAKPVEIGFARPAA